MLPSLPVWWPWYACAAWCVLYIQRIGHYKYITNDIIFLVEFLLQFYSDKRYQNVLLINENIEVCWTCFQLAWCSYDWVHFIYFYRTGQLAPTWNNIFQKTHLRTVYICFLQPIIEPFSCNLYAIKHIEYDLKSQAFYFASRWKPGLPMWYIAKYHISPLMFCHKGHEQYHQTLPFDKVFHMVAL